MYSGIVPFSDHAVWTKGVHYYEELALLYVLGEEIQDQPFQGAVLDTIVTLDVARGKSLTNLARNIIYRGTCSGSPARTFIVDTWVHNGHNLWLENEMEIHPELMRDIVWALTRQRVRPGGVVPWKLNKDAYLKRISKQNA